MKPSNFLLMFGIAIAIVLSVTRIILSATFSTTGIDLDNIQAQTDSLQKENMILKEQVLSQAALTTVAQKATTQGFEESSTKTQLAVTSSHAVPVAYKQ